MRSSMKYHAPTKAYSRSSQGFGNSACFTLSFIPLTWSSGVTRTFANHRMFGICRALWRAGCRRLFGRCQELEFRPEPEGKEAIARARIVPSTKAAARSCIVCIYRPVLAQELHESRGAARSCIISSYRPFVTPGLQKTRMQLGAAYSLTYTQFFA